MRVVIDGHVIEGDRDAVEIAIKHLLESRPLPLIKKRCCRKGGGDLGHSPDCRRLFKPMALCAPPPVVDYSVDYSGPLFTQTELPTPSCATIIPTEAEVLALYEEASDYDPSWRW